MPEEPEVFKKLAEAEATPDLSVPFTGSYEMNQQIIEHKTWLKTIERPLHEARLHWKAPFSSPCHQPAEAGSSHSQRREQFPLHL